MILTVLLRNATPPLLLCVLHPPPCCMCCCSLLRGMMGMSMDGSGQQRAPADAPFSRRRTARVQRETAQEEAERLDALMRAGMGSGEELLRHAVLGPGAPELLEAIAKAGSLYDVESLVKEEVRPDKACDRQLGRLYV